MSEIERGAKLSLTGSIQSGKYVKFHEGDSEVTLANEVVVSEVDKRRRERGDYNDKSEGE